MNRRYQIGSGLASIVSVSSVACGVRLIDRVATPTPSPIPNEDAVPRITATVAYEKVVSGKAILFDTRSADSYRVGHAKNARSSPVAEVERDPYAVLRAVTPGMEAIFYCT